MHKLGDKFQGDVAHWGDLLRATPLALRLFFHNFGENAFEGDVAHWGGLGGHIPLEFGG